MIQLHHIAVNWIYTEPTSEYDLLGGLTEQQEKTAMEVTESDNKFIDMFKGNLQTTVDDIKLAMTRSPDYEDAKDEDIQKAAERVFDKVKTVNSEYVKWFEVLIALVINGNGRRSNAIPNYYTYAYED